MTLSLLEQHLLLATSDTGHDPFFPTQACSSWVLCDGDLGILKHGGAGVGQSIVAHHQDALVYGLLDGVRCAAADCTLVVHTSEEWLANLINKGRAVREASDYKKSNGRQLAHAHLFRAIDLQLTQTDIELSAQLIHTSTDIELLRMVESVRWSAKEGRYNAGAGPGEWEVLS